MDLHGADVRLLVDMVRQYAGGIVGLFSLLLVLQLLRPARRRSTRRRSVSYRPPLHTVAAPHTMAPYAGSPRSRFSGEASADLLGELQVKPLLTPTELKFYRLLCRSAPEFKIFPQVAFQAVLAVPPTLNGFQRWQLRKAIGGKHADFLLCRRDTLQVQTFVELDDRSHDGPKRQEADARRDLILRQAGYRVVRFDCRAWPGYAQVRMQLGLPVAFDRALPADTRVHTQAQ